VGLADYSALSYPLWIAPLYGRVSSPSGIRTNPITNRREFHDGIDIAAPIGTPVVAPRDGTIIAVGASATWGNFVRVAHEDGYMSFMAHLHRATVRVGDSVGQGEKIAYSGNTGRSTGPHLHYEIRYLGQPIPPRELIDFETYTAKYRKIDVSAHLFAYVRDLEQVRFYTVRSGDTLSGISRKLGVSIDKICQLNSIRRTSILRIGQRLRYT
jgi:murein DD-endopeptidase MepM/ murein hydrolase activator NlpD